MLYFPLGNYTQEKKEVYEDVCLTTSLTNTWPYESFDKCLSLSFFIFSMAKPIFIFLWLFIGYSWWIYNAFRFSHPGTFYLPHITQLKNNSKPLGSNLLKASHNEKKKKKKNQVQCPRSHIWDSLAMGPTHFSKLTSCSFSLFQL